MATLRSRRQNMMSSVVSGLPGRSEFCVQEAQYIISGYTNLPAILNALRQTSLQEMNHIIWKYNFGVYTRRKFVSYITYPLLCQTGRRAYLSYALPLWRDGEG